MSWEIAGQVLASLGGAAAILAAFAGFLGKVWSDRISKSTAAKFNAELESLKSQNAIALEGFKARSSVMLKEMEAFSSISQQVYQEFLSKRIHTYQQLLDEKNNYIKQMEEDFFADDMDKLGEIYHGSYVAFRTIITQHQLYISTDLDRSFTEFRKAAAKHLKDAQFVDAYLIDEPNGERQRDVAYERFSRDTRSQMDAFLNQIASDVSKLRARIDIDKADNGVTPTQDGKRG